MDSGWLSSRGRKVALATAAAFALWFGFDALIVTERERIEARIESLRAEFEAKRLEPIRAFVADDYAYGGTNKAGLLQQADAFLASYDPDRIGYGIRSLSVSGDTAEVDGVCLVTPGRRSQVPAPLRGPVRLKLRRDPDGEWRLVGLETRD